MDKRGNLTNPQSTTNLVFARVTRNLVSTPSFSAALSPGKRPTITAMDRGEEGGGVVQADCMKGGTYLRNTAQLLSQRLLLRGSLLGGDAHLSREGRHQRRDGGAGGQEGVGGPHATSLQLGLRLGGCHKVPWETEARLGVLRHDLLLLLRKPGLHSQRWGDCRSPQVVLLLQASQQRGVQPALSLPCASNPSPASIQLQQRIF